MSEEKAAYPAAPEHSTGTLSRDAILAASDMQTETLHVPEWGGSVIVRSMTGAQRDAYESSLMIGRGQNQQVNVKNARAKLVVRCVVDEQGKQLFSDEDVKALGAKNASAIKRVFDVGARLSGLSDDDFAEMTQAFD